MKKELSFGPSVAFRRHPWLWILVCLVALGSIVILVDRVTHFTGTAGQSASPSAPAVALPPAPQHAADERRTQAETPATHSLPAKGINVSRAEIQATSAKANLSFTWREADLEGGTPRLLGLSANNFVLVELKGPPNDLTEITCVMAPVNDSPVNNAVDLVYVARLIKTVAPAWTEGPKWFASQSVDLMNTDAEGERQTVYGELRFTLWWTSTVKHAAGKDLVLSIKCRE